MVRVGRRYARHVRSLAIALIFGAGISVAEPPSPPPLEWRTVAPDLEIVELTGGFLAADLLVVRTGLERYRVSVVQASSFGRERASVRQLADLSGAILAINANFFDNRGRPLGLIVSGGSTYQRIHHGGRTLTGIFSVGSEGMQVSSRSSYSPTYVSEAIQAGPRLVANGRAVPEPSSSGASSRRSGVCLDRQGRLLFFTVSSGLFGMTLEKLQEVLTRPGIDCLDALNLDGGGSSQLFVRSPSTPGGNLVFFPGKDDVPVALALFERSLPVSAETPHHANKQVNE